MLKQTHMISYNYLKNGRVLSVPTFAWNDKERQEVNAVRYVDTHAWLKRLGLSKCERNSIV